MPFVYSNPKGNFVIILSEDHGPIFQGLLKDVRPIEEIMEYMNLKERSENNSLEESFLQLSLKKPDLINQP